MTQFKSQARLRLRPPAIPWVEPDFSRYLSCEVCFAITFKKQGDIFVCTECGSRYYMELKPVGSYHVSL